MPADWQIAELRDVVDPEHKIRYGIIQPGKYDSTGRYMVRGQDYSFGWVAESQLFRVSAPIETRYKNARLAPGDVLMTIVGANTGHVAVVPDWLGGANITQTTARIRTNRARMNNRFCLYFFQSSAGKRVVQNFIKGNAQPGLNIRDVEIIHVPLPPLPEQQAIAEALGDVDALIESLEKLITKKRLIKQGAMQELLTGKRRLPGFAKSKKTKQTEIGMIPEDWEVRTLGAVAHIKTGERNNQDKEENGQYPFFVRSATVERINSYSYDCEAILVPGEGGIGSIFHYIVGKFDVHQRVYAITQFAPEMDARFIFHYMHLHFGRHAMTNTVKATVDSLRLPTFTNFSIAVPQHAEQRAIAEVLGDIDSEIELLETKLSKTRQLKQGMMQELLTGRIRLV
ncbi:MAG: restriction endonuclease subunit S [Spirochaetaceae bacterium]|nr:restriction endonuclease subunit S [Spirochaetaceae bacterium]